MTGEEWRVTAGVVARVAGTGVRGAAPGPRPPGTPRPICERLLRPCRRYPRAPPSLRPAPAPPAAVSLPSPRESAPDQRVLSDVTARALTLGRVSWQRSRRRRGRGRAWEGVLPLRFGNRPSSTLRFFAASPCHTDTGVPRQERGCVFCPLCCFNVEKRKV